METNCSAILYLGKVRECVRDKCNRSIMSTNSHVSCDVMPLDTEKSYGNIDAIQLESPGSYRIYCQLAGC